MSDFEQVQLADYVKRKRRRAFLWGAGVTAVLGCLIWGLGAGAGPSFPAKGDHIARIRIEGGIFTDQKRQDMIDEIADRDDVKALIVEINSPGGAVYPSYLMYERISEIAENIPTVAIMESYAASGGLMVAMGADYVLASPVTVTGSIGVIGEMNDFAGLMEKIGVGNTVFRTSDVKGGPSPFRKPTQAEIASVNKELGDINDVFKNIVAKSRGLDQSELARVATGEAFIGKRAVDLKLVDALGGEQQAAEYLENLDASYADMEIEDWEPLYEPEEAQSLLDQFASSVVSGVFQEIEAKRFDRVQY